MFLFISLHHGTIFCAAPLLKSPRFMCSTDVSEAMQYEPWPNDMFAVGTLSLVWFHDWTTSLRSVALVFLFDMTFVEMWHRVGMCFFVCIGVLIRFWKFDCGRGQEEAQIECNPLWYMWLWWNLLQGRCRFTEWSTFQRYRRIVELAKNQKDSDFLKWIDSKIAKVSNAPCITCPFLMLLRSIQRLKEVTARPWDETGRNVR